MSKTPPGFSQEDIVREVRAIQRPGFYGRLILEAISGKIAEMQVVQTKRPQGTGDS